MPSDEMLHGNSIAYFEKILNNYVDIQILLFLQYNHTWSSYKLIKSFHIISPKASVKNLAAHLGYFFNINFCFLDFSQPFLMINVQEDPRNNKSIDSSVMARYVYILSDWIYNTKLIKCSDVL